MLIAAKRKIPLERMLLGQIVNMGRGTSWLYTGLKRWQKRTFNKML